MDKEKEKKNSDDNPAPNPANTDENIYKLNQEQKYDININYLDQNPFSKWFTNGSKMMGVGIGLFSSAAILDGAVTTTIGALSILGGMGLSGLGLFISIPGIVGTGMYKIYKIFKTKKCEQFYKELQTSEKMKEEREVYIEVLSKIDKYFINYLSEQTKNYVKQKIELATQNILNIIFEQEDSVLSQIIEDYKKIYSNVSKFNIMLVGKTGVGKSTLINGVLNLRQNEAKEGENETPQKIEGFLKKYPIKSEDTKVKGINLWDTEGIEFSNKNENDIESHKKRILEHIDKLKTIPNEQINCLWFCVNGPRLEDADKKYIESLLEIYNEESKNGKLKTILEGYKLPIIFVYTKAYNSEDENIEKIENALKKINYFIEYGEEFKFIEVIAKEKKYKNMRTKKVEVESKLNIKELVDISLEKGEKGMSLPLLYSSNLLFKELNDKANKMVNNLSILSIELMKTILSSNNTNIDQIVEEAVPIFIKLIKALRQENLDNSTEGKIELFVKDIICQLKELFNNYYKKAINSFDKKKFMSSFRDLLSKKFEIKKDSNISFKEFESNCNDYIISLFADNISKYAVLSSFNYIREIIFNYSFEKYNINLNLKKNKIKELFKKYSKENYNRFIQNFAYEEE